MRFFRMPTSTEDRFSRGLRDAVLVLGGVVLTGAAFGFAVEPFEWLTGVVKAPAVVRVTRRGPDDLVEYSAGVAWRLLLFYLFSGVLFAAGTAVAACKAVGVFQRAGRKAGQTRQRKRRVGRPSRTEGRPRSCPEPQNAPPLQRMTQPLP